MRSSEAPLGSETVRRGESLRVYRQLQEKYAVLIGGVLIFGVTTVQLVELLIRDEPGVKKHCCP